MEMNLLLSNLKSAKHKFLEYSRDKILCPLKPWSLIQRLWMCIFVLSKDLSIYFQLGFSTVVSVTGCDHLRVQIQREEGFSKVAIYPYKPVECVL